MCSHLLRHEVQALQRALRARRSNVQNGVVRLYAKQQRGHQHRRVLGSSTQHLLRRNTRRKCGSESQWTSTTVSLLHTEAAHVLAFLTVRTQQSARLQNDVEGTGDTYTESTENQGGSTISTLTQPNNTRTSGECCTCTIPNTVHGVHLDQLRRNHAAQNVAQTKAGSPTFHGFLRPYHGPMAGLSVAEMAFSF